MDTQKQLNNPSATPLAETMSRLEKRFSSLKNQSPELETASEDETKRRHAIIRLSNDLGPRYSPARASLSAFQVYHKDQKAILERLEVVRSKMPEFVSSGSGLCFFGSVGTGKDHLLAAMLYAAATCCIPCKWVNGQEVYGRFREAINADRSESEIINDLSEPAVLAISDPIPPASTPTPWNIQQLYRLLDRRYRAMKPTWVTLNSLTTEDADNKLSAPVFDRLREGSEMIRCFWPSWRERKAV